MAGARAQDAGAEGRVGPSERTSARDHPHAASQRRLYHHLCRHHRSAPPRVGTGEGQVRRRTGEPGEVGIPRQYEPRDPHADERRDRHDRAAAGYAPQRRATRVRRGGPRQCRRAAERDQRYSRHLQARGAPRRAGNDRFRAGRNGRERRRADVRQGEREERRARRLHFAGACGRASTAIRPGCGRFCSILSATRSNSPSRAASRSTSRWRRRRPPKARRWCGSKSPTPASAWRRKLCASRVPEIHPGRQFGDAPVRRHRSRPGHLPRAGRADGRAHRRREQARRRQQVLVRGARLRSPPTRRRSSPRRRRPN